MNDSDFDKLFNEKLNGEGEFPQSDENWEKVAVRLSSAQNTKLLRTRLYRAAVIALIAGIFAWQWTTMHTMKNEIADLKNNYELRIKNKDSLQKKLEESQDFENKNSEKKSEKNNFENKKFEKNSEKNNFESKKFEKNNPTTVLEKNNTHAVSGKNNPTTVLEKNNTRVVSEKYNPTTVLEKNNMRVVSEKNNPITVLEKNNAHVVSEKNNPENKNGESNSGKNNAGVVLENNKAETKSEENMSIKDIPSSSRTTETDLVKTRTGDTEIKVAGSSLMPANEIAFRSQVISELSPLGTSPIAMHSNRLILSDDGGTLKQSAPIIRITHPSLLQNFSITAQIGTDIHLMQNRDDDKPQNPKPNPNPNPNLVPDKNDPHTNFNSNINYGITIEKSFGSHWRAQISANYAQSNFITEADNPKIYVPEPPHIKDFDFENAHADFKSWFLGAGVQYAFFEHSRVQPFVSLGYAYESVQPFQINYEYKSKLTEGTQTQSNLTTTHNENWYNIGVGADMRLYKNISARVKTDYWNTLSSIINKKMMRIQGGIVVSF